MYRLTIKPEIKIAFTMLLGLFLGLSLFTFNIIGFDFSFFPGDLGMADYSIFRTFPIKIFY